jgi:argininosuccinate lyase
MKLADVELDDLKKYSPVIERDVYRFLGAANVVARYVTEGSAGTKQAKQSIAFWNKQLAKR